MVETPGRGRLRRAARARQGCGRERFRVGQVFARLHQGATTAWSRRSDELRRNRHRRGHQRRLDRVSLAQSRREDAAARARRAGERRHGKERRDHPPELFDAPARPPRARQHRDVRNAQRPSSARTRASCRTATASWSQPRCSTARRRTSRCRRASASSTNGRRARVFRSICLRSIPRASPASCTSRMAATPIRCRRPRRTSMRSRPSAASFARARRCGGCCATATASPASSSTTAKSAPGTW